MLNQSFNKPFAIIIGLATLQGLQAARILAHRNVPVIAIANDRKHFSCRTNVCKQIYIADTKTDEFITLLESIGPTFFQRPVLFPCRDESVLMLSRHRHRLQAFYNFLLPDHDNLELLVDKNSFYKYSAKHNHPVPLTYEVNSEQEFAAVLKRVRFPCVLKPPYRVEGWTKNSAYKAYKVHNARELIPLYKICRNWVSSLLVQEWVEGTDEDLFSCNCYFDADSKPLVTFVARKIRQWPPEVGESSLGQECRNDEVLREALKLFSSTGLKGLGYLEMKRDRRTGCHYIIEPNIGRPTGRSAIAEAGGVELLYTMYSDLLNWPLPTERKQQYTNVKWIHLTRDCASALHLWRDGKLTVSGWLSSLRGKKIFAVFCWKDLGPFLWDMIRAFKILVARKERQRRNATLLGTPKDFKTTEIA